MAQSLASIPWVREAGGLREEIWSWPAVPARPEPQAQAKTEVPTEITQVLAAWRAAEHRLQDLVEASPMRTLVRSEVVRLRSEYHRLFAMAKR